MSRSNVLRHFDLPVKHLERGFDYVPPRARNPDEIERRKRIGPGTLLSEYQQKGIRVAKRVLRFTAETQPDDPFVPELLAVAEFNTAWYNHAAGARDVMRRRLYLPRLDEASENYDRSNMLTDAAFDLKHCEEIADVLRISLAGRHSATPRLQKKLGMELGDASLRLVSQTRVEQLRPHFGDAEVVQQIARHAALEVVELSRELYRTMHANPSIAQLADKDSPLSVHWRRNGTDHAVNALEHALS